MTFLLFISHLYSNYKKNIFLYSILTKLFSHVLDVFTFILKMTVKNVYVFFYDILYNDVIISQYLWKLTAFQHLAIRDVNCVLHRLILPNIKPVGTKN